MIRLSENEALKNRHSFGVTTFSRFFLETDNTDELFDFYNSHPEIISEFLVIGEGSNLLFKEDYQGLIIHPISKGIELLEQKNNELIIEVGATENWDYLVDWTVSKGYYGLENLSLIPGSVGAAPIQNIGAYGAEAKDFITEVYVADIENKNCFWLPADKCEFAYRKSIFKNKPNWLVWKVRFKLSINDKINLKYQGLKEQLFDFPNPGPKEVRQAVIEVRSSKLPDPKEIGNAGSFFKNPIVAKEQSDSLLAEFHKMPTYPCNQKGTIKLAAGWLIEECGLKGFRKGDAGTAQKQALVIVNHGNATGNDLANMASFIQDSVWEKFKIKLEPEVRIV